MTRFTQKLTAQSFGPLDLPLFPIASALFVLNPPIEKNHKDHIFENSAMAVQPMVEFLELPEWLSSSAQRSKALSVAVDRSYLSKGIKLPSKPLLHPALNLVEELARRTPPIFALIVFNARQGSGDVFP
ncbi:MAG: hypothetical protein WCE53_00805 [Candidatus Acidiferrum sp.]